MPRRSGHVSWRDGPDPARDQGESSDELLSSDDERDAAVNVSVGLLKRRDWNTKKEKENPGVRV
jgi:hypothetical protein